jgi:hypothetical protein
MRYLQLNENNVVSLVAPRRPVSATLGFYSPSGALISSPSVALDALVATISGVADFSFTATPTAGAIAAQKQYWLTSATEGEALFKVANVASSVVTYEERLPLTVNTSTVMRGATLTATIQAASVATLGLWHQLRWTVTFADGTVQTINEAASVCRTVFLPPMTPEMAARHAGYAFPSIASQRKAAYWVDIAARASQRIEQRVIASGRMPHLLGDSTMLQDPGFTSLRIELARDGLVPAGFDGGQFVQQMEEELKQQMEWALSSTWHDTNENGAVDADERGGPKSIRLERV